MASLPASGSERQKQPIDAPLAKDVRYFSFSSSEPKASNPYKTRIKRYTAITNHRAIDDEVMLEGLKSYYSIDDTDTNNTGLITLRSGIYTNTLNNWIGSITNIQGALTVEINEYT